MRSEDITRNSTKDSICNKTVRCGDSILYWIVTLIDAILIVMLEKCIVDSMVFSESDFSCCLTFFESVEVIALVAGGVLGTVLYNIIVAKDTEFDPMCCLASALCALFGAGIFVFLAYVISIILFIIQVIIAVFIICLILLICN